MNRITVIACIELSLAQCFIGLNLVMGKSLLDDFPVLLLLSLRFVISSLILIPLCMMGRQKLHQDHFGRRFTRKDWLVFFAQAMCGGLLFNIFILAGMHYTTATTAGIISSTTPAAIALLSYVILKETLGLNKLIAIAISVIGLMVLSLGVDTHTMDAVGQSSLLGIFLILMSVIPEAFFTILAKWHVSNTKPFVKATLMNLFNTLLFLPVLVWQSWDFNFSFITWQAWLLLFLYGSTGSIFFYIFWYRGLSNTSASTAALFTCVMPVSTTLFSSWFLGETMRWFDILSMACILLAIVFGAIRLPRKRT